MIASATAVADSWARRILPAAAVIVLLLVVVIWMTLPSLTDSIAHSIFANAPVAFDTEAAPTAWLPLWSNVEAGALAGRGEGLD